jgi:hypothetical protein
MRAVISKPADAGVKKRAAIGDYRKKRWQPLSEEASSKSRAAAQKAAAARKKNPEPVKRRQVKVGMRFDSTLAKKGVCCTASLMDVGSLVTNLIYVCAHVSARIMRIYARA